MTFIILTKDGKGQQIERSILRLVESKMPNHCADKEAGVESNHPEEFCSEAIHGYDDKIEKISIISYSNKHQSTPR